MMTGLDTAGHANPRPAKLIAVGDCALLVEFENRISAEINDRVLNLARQVDQSAITGIKAAVPAYRTLLIHYDPLTIDYQSLCAAIRPLLSGGNIPAQSGKHWLIPVHYGGEAALDLPDLASRHGLSEEQVIDIHSSAVYRVYMMGFAPGWTFLGGLDTRLYTPRLDSPRAEVPAGCISIGGEQTLIGGQAMPSGWNLIGRTPERSFAPERHEPFFMAAGDEVSFRRINQDEFDHLSQQAADGARVSRELAPQ
jgi:KipI family sensor histidine kinase inhibitor